MLVERDKGLLRFHEAIMERRRPLPDRFRHQPLSRLPGLRHKRSLQRGMFFLSVVRFGHGLKLRGRVLIRFFAFKKDGGQLSQCPLGQQQS